LSADFVENLGWQKIAPAFFAFNTSLCFKDNESLADKASAPANAPYLHPCRQGLSPYQELFCWILRPGFSQNRKAILPHPMDDIKTNSLNINFNIL
jgi:hypothetical protein